MKYQIFSKTQKWAILERVGKAKNKERELALLGIPRSTYYAWLKTNGETRKKTPKNIWNKTPDEIEAKIKEYRLSGDPRKQSPMRIAEQLEQNDGYLLTESGVKSVLVRNKLNGFLKPKKRHYHIRPRAEKFFQTVCLDDIEFLRFKPKDTFVLNFSDEASYFALESRVFGHRPCASDIVSGLKMLKLKYGKYPKTLRLDNARAHWSRKVLRFCKRNNIVPDFIDKGCPEENWPIESWHRNLNQDLIYRKGYATIAEWQRAIDEYREWHNYSKRLRSDPIERTPAEIAFAYTTPLTQARLKTKLQRKLYGQTAVQKYIETKNRDMSSIPSVIMPTFVSKMCVS
jgi:transposase